MLRYQNSGIYSSRAYLNLSMFLWSNRHNSENYFLVIQITFFLLFWQGIHTHDKGSTTRDPPPRQGIHLTTRIHDKESTPRQGIHTRDPKSRHGIHTRRQGIQPTTRDPNSRQGIQCWIPLDPVGSRWIPCQKNHVLSWHKLTLNVRFLVIWCKPLDDQKQSM